MEQDYHHHPTISCSPVTEVTAESDFDNKPFLVNAKPNRALCFCLSVNSWWSICAIFSKRCCDVLLTVFWCQFSSLLNCVFSLMLCMLHLPVLESPVWMSVTEWMLLHRHTLTHQSAALPYFSRNKCFLKAYLKWREDRLQGSLAAGRHLRLVAFKLDNQM